MAVQAADAGQLAQGAGLAAVRRPAALPRARAPLSPAASPGAAPPVAAAPVAAPAGRAGWSFGRGPWAAGLASATLHASAALALVAAQVALGAGAAGEAGLDSLSLPAPPAVSVELLTLADLLPDTPPPTVAAAPAALPMPAPDMPSPPQMDALPDVAMAPPAAPIALAAPLLSDNAPDALPPPPPPPVAELAPVAEPTPDPTLAAARPRPRPERLAEPAQQTAKAKPAKAKPAKEAAASKPAKPASKAAGAGGGAKAGDTGKAADPGPSKAEVAELKAAWGAKVRARVEARKAYPSAAKGAAGTVKVRLTVSRAGALIGASVAASSGNGALDKAALKAVTSARFPAAPKGLRDDSYSFTLPMRFAP